MAKNSFTFVLDQKQQQTLIEILQKGNYIPKEVPHTRIAVNGPNCNISLYESGKCLVQGKGAQEWAVNVMEPLVLQEARIGYEDLLNPALFTPHMGIDESGKGDYFGPLVIAAVYVDETTVQTLQSAGVRDSKTISTDKRIEAIARDIRSICAPNFSVVTIGPLAYNRLQNKMRTVNNVLAWGHARSIENLLEKKPQCPRAVADQFGPKHQIEKALLKNGKKIKLEQRHKAESDPAVAAASILARAAFLYALKKMGEAYDVTIPKGASAKVKETAIELAKKHGPAVLIQNAKIHFKTTAEVLTKAGISSDELEALKADLMQ